MNKDDGIAELHKRLRRAEKAELRRQLHTTKTEHARITKENDYLRVFAQKAGCPYGNTNESGGCKSGYPGCACADDLMVFLDEHSKVLVDEKKALETQLTEALSRETALAADVERLRLDLQDVINQCKVGFIRCGHCGEQEDLEDCDIQWSPRKHLKPNPHPPQPARSFCGWLLRMLGGVLTVIYTALLKVWITFLNPSLQKRKDC